MDDKNTIKFKPKTKPNNNESLKEENGINEEDIKGIEEKSTIKLKFSPHDYDLEYAKTLLNTVTNNKYKTFIIGVLTDEGKCETIVSGSGTICDTVNVANILKLECDSVYMNSKSFNESFELLNILFKEDKDENGDDDK